MLTIAGGIALFFIGLIALSWFLKFLGFLFEMLTAPSKSEIERERLRWQESIEKEHSLSQ
jgi:hypothetical protein